MVNKRDALLQFGDSFVGNHLPNDLGLGSWVSKVTNPTLVLGDVILSVHRTSLPLISSAY